MAVLAPTGGAGPVGTRVNALAGALGGPQGVVGPPPTGLNSPAHTGAGIGDVNGYQGVINKAVTPQPGFLGHSLQDWQNLAAAGQNPYGQANMPNYQGAFQSAMSAARGNIQDQLTGALSDIQNSQLRAGQALGQYAPMVNANYKEGMGGAATAGNAIDAAIAKSGVHTLMPSSAYVAPDRAAVANTHTQDLSNQALLNTGIQQQGEHERALANLAAQQQYGGLAQAQMGFDASLAGQQMGNQNALQMAQLQQGYGNANALRDFSLQQQLAQQSPQSSAAPATGVYAPTGLTEGQVLQAHANTNYSGIVKDVLAGKYTNDALQMKLRGDPILLSTIQAEYASHLK